MSDSGKSGGAKPARYGPFHRVETATQTPEDARRQERSGEIWGRTPYGSAWPQVQALDGPLPRGVRGVEFYTDSAPDEGGHPLQPRWSGNGLNTDVRTEDGFAKIPCVVVKNAQRRPS